MNKNTKMAGLLMLAAATLCFGMLDAARTNGGSDFIINNGQRRFNVYSDNYNNNFNDREQQFNQRKSLEQHLQISQQEAQDVLNTKSGFSTFGIICMIFAIIVVCLVFYYGIMCYPLLCRRNKASKDPKWTNIDASSTPATSRSIQSIENYPVDQKH